MREGRDGGEKEVKEKGVNEGGERWGIERVKEEGVNEGEEKGKQRNCKMKEEGYTYS